MIKIGYNKKAYIDFKNPKDRKKLIIEIVLIILALMFLIPVYYMVVTTFKTPDEAVKYPMSLPKNFTLDYYKTAFVQMQYPRALFNTAFIAAMTVLINLTISTLAAYTLARRETRLNKIIFMFFIAGMMIPVQMGLTSLYKLMKDMHLVNNPFSVILINSSGGCIASIFMIKSFIKTSIPKEIEEAAFIDGCGVFKVFFNIVLPLLKPVLATLTIIVMLNSWNDFMNPLLFLQSRSRGVILQEVNRNIGQFAVDWSAMFPMLVLGILPLTIAYVLLQKYIIKGVSAGAVKG